MPPRNPKPKTIKQVVLQLYNMTGNDRVAALLIDEILVAYNSVLRIRLPGYEDPLFLQTDGDNRIRYNDVFYTDFSVSTVEEAKDWLDSISCPIVPFCPTQAQEQ